MPRLLIVPRGAAVVALVVAAAVCPPSIAYGASLTGTSRQVAAGFQAVRSCNDASMTGPTFAWTARRTSGTVRVVAAEVYDLPTLAACNDVAVTAAVTLAGPATAYTNLANGTATTVSSGSVPFTTLSANPTPGDVGANSVYFSVVGP